jgi:uncharacterized protein
MKIKKDFIDLFTGIDLTKRRLPYMEADSGKPGPVVSLSAAIHGDEVTGTAVIQKIFAILETHPLKKGKILAFPILNPPAFETISRREPYDEEDLNRQFDGDFEGSTAERLAGTIFGKIMEQRPDYAIDLHTDSMNSIAYTIVDLPTSLKDIGAFMESVAVAEELGFKWALDTEKTAGFPPENCLSGRLVYEGIPAVTIELGGPLLVIDAFKRQGVDAIWSFLKSLGMIDGKMTFDTKKVPMMGFTFAERVRTQSTGIIEYKVRPGSLIEKGDTLGKIRNVFGETIEVIKAPVAGVLFSHEDQSVTFPGQTLFTIAVEADMPVYTGSPQE